MRLRSALAMMLLAGVLTTFMPDEASAGQPNPTPSPSASHTHSGGNGSADVSGQWPLTSLDAADMWSVVSDDPEAAFNEIAPHCYYQINTYAEWQKDTDWGKNYINRMDFETFKKSGAIKAMTPEEAIKYIRSRQDLAPIESFCLQVPSGIPLKAYAKFAGTFAEKVLPAFR